MSIPTREQYQELFDTMVIDTSHQSEIDEAIRLIQGNWMIYKSLVEKVNQKCPWYAVGIIHYMECDCNFNEHIHNGNPLTGRTYDAPSGRPIADPINPPNYSWEESVTDWVRLKKWDVWVDWQIPDILYRCEQNNGFGNEAHGINSPYLWSYTSNYVKGKFVSDGKFNPDAISKQVGSAILLKHFFTT